MNLVGKIFVGIIALMSVVCLTLSVVSYASHRNWKEESAKLDAQIKKLEGEKTAMSAEKTALENAKAEAVKNYEQIVKALDSKVAAMTAENQTLKANNEQLEKDLQARVDAIATSGQTINTLNEQIALTTQDLATAQQLRASYLRDLAQTMANLHEISGLLGNVQEQNVDLTKAHDDVLAVLQQHGLNPDPSLYAELPKVAVRGTIEEVKEGPDGLTMISIGSDDGLAVGNQLHVRRGDVYLGKLEVVVVEPNRAVCKVLGEYRQGTMLEGDEVYSQEAN
jgi:septal ring factor EnvC (AmiA/AmiB activator)